jgi:competence protein ComEA
MSSKVKLVEAPDGEREPVVARQTAAVVARPPEARTLLAFLVVVMAIGLLTVSPKAGSSSRAPIGVARNLVLDANTAPPQVLSALPTLGPTLVGRWAAARAERPISSLDDARRRVRGLGPASLARLAPYLRFKPEPVELPEHLAARMMLRDRSWRAR